MRYVASCRWCATQVSADSEETLRDAIESLDGDTCGSWVGHDMKQVLPP